MSPKRIGRYTILRNLPPGGMAEVFVARRDGLETPCVLKRMRMGIGDNQVITQRFIREAQVASRLDHPHIAKVFEASIEEGALCMAVELVEGHDLSAIMYEMAKRKVRLTYGVAAGIVLRILDGLHYAHTFRHDGLHLEIVHRDAGPRNVMIGRRGEVKIIDFGLAKAGFGQVLTASGVLLGTPRYMAPEQARGEVVDARADVYAAAVTLWELMTGRALVKDPEPIDALRTVIEVEPPRLCNVDPTAPRELTPVLDRALQKDRADRYQSAIAFRDEIIRACRRVDVASDRDIADFMHQHFPKRDDVVSEIGAFAHELGKFTSDADTIVVDPDSPTMDTPIAEIGDTPTAPEQAPIPHQKIDLTIPKKPRVRVRARRPGDFWRIAAYVLAAVAIVMVGIVAYRFAAS